MFSGIVIFFYSIDRETLNIKFWEGGTIDIYTLPIPPSPTVPALLRPYISTTICLGISGLLGLT